MSKRIFRTILVVSLLLTVVCVIVALRLGDLTDLVRLAELWVGASAIYSAFYLWKAKNENRSKYAQRWVNALAKQYGIDAAARFAEIVLKD